MLNQTQVAPLETVERLGELHPLMAQLGSADGLVTLGAVAAALRLPQVDSRRTLTLFLQAYRNRLLLPVELPAICRAYADAMLALPALGEWIDAAERESETIGKFDLYD